MKTALVWLVLTLVVSIDVQGQSLKHIESLQYPNIARSAQIQGDVSVEIDVDESGLVKDLRTTSGHRILQDAVKSAVQSWRFDSGKPGTVRMLFTFRLELPKVEYFAPTKMVLDLPGRVTVSTRGVCPDHSFDPNCEYSSPRPKKK